jgi:class 3 adenylate cyclase
MVEIIDRHHGCIIEFSGHSILCAFGAPEPRTNHAELAVRCAIEMQAELERAHRTWENAETKLWHGQGTNRLRMHIGIHTGAVIAGNVGARSRVKYAVIGEPLNVVARVEHLNAELKTETLLTDDALVRLPAELRGRTEALGDYPVVGRGRAVTIHVVR